MADIIAFPQRAVPEVEPAAVPQLYRDKDGRLCFHFEEGDGFESHAFLFEIIEAARKEELRLSTELLTAFCGAVADAVAEH